MIARAGGQIVPPMPASGTITAQDYQTKVKEINAEAETQAEAEEESMAAALRRL